GCAPDEYDDLISGTCSHLPKLLYGDGLHIQRLERGTEIAFYVPNERSRAHTTTSLLPQVE
ncbi:hypothetical protein, partial [Enterobacter asburiae]|uniref:hypothetical protein n=1 Tax=Enterobacter asburiae TaxID=61645 RepID=UPI001F14C2AF